MKFKLASTTLTDAEKQREDMALKIFSYEKVEVIIKQAATNGHNSCRIIQETYADLYGTKVAGQLVNKLKQAGYKCEWTEATQKENVGQKESLVTIVYHELLISWGKTNRRLLGQSEEA